MEYPDWEGLLAIYVATLEEQAVTMYDSNEEVQFGYIKRHARHMLDNMPDRVTDEATFQRWLGFIQAILWITRTYTIEQLQEQTRRAAGEVEDKKEEV